MAISKESAESFAKSNTAAEIVAFLLLSYIVSMVSEEKRSGRGSSKTPENRQERLSSRIVI